ncbi:uncharacterized protein LOC130732383 [Lotus japonicus]|uniref:uncharacterized protein LOC130732383 n=1 Tax=Lotus japonicus TaxID=34305 RepID=UPI002582908D|nr:uncharacterized protein LOC130732383 [Lotus japonicus]
MDSPPPHNGRRESTSGDQSSTNRDSSQQPPPVAPPHMMYNYPPGTGYSGHYQNPYPPPPPHGYAPYPNQPPNGYNYPPQYYGAPPPYRTGNRGSGFCRGFIMCTCIIFTTFFVATVVMALVLHPQLPLYNVTSLSVANFNTTPSLTGDWNISVVIENPNDKLRGFFSDFKVEMVRVNNVVAASSMPNFEMEKKEKKQIDMRASSNVANSMSFQKLDLDLMAKERESGSVTFGLKVSSMTAFKSSSLSTRNALMLAVCQGLKVVFQNNTGFGTLDNGGKPVNCQLFM